MTMLVNAGRQRAAVKYSNICTMLAELDYAKESDDMGGEEEALQKILVSSLAVLERSGWAPLGDELTMAEFQILLCADESMVRVCGKLDNGTPCYAWMEYQSGGAPWLQYLGASSAVLCRYAAHFISGD